MIKMQSKIKAKEKAKEITNYWKINMMKIDPGAIGFTSGFSQEHKYFTVGEQITVEQMTELSIVMRISRYDQYIGITSVTSRPTPACIYYYYSTHRPLSSMHLEY